MYRKVLVTLGILCFLSTARAKADDVGYAYCPLGEGYVFLYDSLTGFQVLADLKCGEKLTVVDPRNNDRARVRTEKGIEGWVQKSSLIAALPGTQRQPVATPDAGSQPQQAPQAPQAPVQPKPQAQVSKPQPQPEAPAQPEPQAAPQVQPQPRAELETEAQPQPEPQAPTQPQAQPQPEPQLQAQAQPQPPAPSPAAAKLPPPAAVAFTPFSTLGYEQNVPRLEVSAGYSFMNAGTDALANRQNLSGLDSSVAYNVNRWVAAEGDVAAYYKTITILGVGTFPYHDYLIAGGPRVTVRKFFLHGLIGMDHLTNHTYFYGPGPSTGNNVLAAELGGGVQWKVASHIGVRTSVDYVMSKFDGWIQSSVRVTGGVVFNLGRL